MMISTAALAISVVLVGTDEAVDQEATPSEPGTGMQFETESLLTPGTWWNLHFAKEHEILKRGATTVHAVRVVQVDRDRPNWIRIAYPRRVSEHLELLREPEQSEDGKSLEELLEGREDNITDWKTQWVNLDYVVRMDSVRGNYARQLAGVKMGLEIRIEQAE